MEWRNRSTTLVLLLFVSLPFLIALIWWANPQEVLQTLQQTRPKYLLLGLGVANLAVVSRVMKWKVLFYSQDKNLGFFDLLPPQMLGTSISNLTPAKSGSPAKSIIMKMYNGRPVSETLPTIIWERVWDLVVLISLGLMSVSILTFDIGMSTAVIVSIGVFIILIIILLISLYKESIGRRVFGFFNKFPLLNRINENFILNFYEQDVSKKGLLFSFLFTGMTWTFEGLIFYLFLRSFSVYLPFTAVIGIFSMSILVGVLSSLPGGLGPTGVSLVTLFGLLNVSKSVATSVAMLGRVFTLGYIFLLGYLSFLYLSPRLELEKVF